MVEIAITRMSSKGQIVVPKNIREELGFHSGDVFALIGRRDSLILKRVEIPTEQDLQSLLEWGHEYAKEKGITREDVEKAIAETRGLEPK